MNEQVSLASLAEKVRLLETEKEIMLGRLNALHSVVLQMAMDRDNPTQHLVDNLKIANERSIADMLGHGLSDLMTNEFTRVVTQMADILQASASGLQKPR
jgi:hypothetical protein